MDIRKFFLFRLFKDAAAACFLPIRATYNVSHDLSAAFNRSSFRLLENGLEAFQKTAMQDKVIQMRIMIRSGANDDPEDKQGLAHLAEHMIFATEDSEICALLDAFKKKGGSCNASTSDFATFYEFRIPKGWGNERLLYRTAARMIFRPVINDLQTAFEKEVIASEMDFKEDQTKDDVSNKLLIAAYGAQKFQKNIVGSPESLNNITASDVGAFFSAHYIPANASVSVSGIPAFSNFFKLLQDEFGDLPHASPVPKKENPSLVYQGGSLHAGNDSGLKQVRIVAGVCLGNISRNDTLSVLSYYFHDALYKHFREKDSRRLYYAEAYPLNCAENTLLCLEAHIKPEYAGEILPAMADLIKDVAGGKVDIECFNRAIAATRLSHARSHDFRMRGGEAAGDSLSHDWNYCKEVYSLRRIRPYHLTQMIEKSMEYPPSLATIGDHAEIQKYEEFMSMLPLQLRQNPSPVVDPAVIPGPRAEL